MIGWLLLIAFGAFVSFVVLTSVSGRLALQLRIGALTINAAALLLAAVMIAQIPPWGELYLDPKGHSYDHRAMVVLVVINFIFAIGPQWLAIMMAGAGLYVARSAHDHYTLHKRGIFRS